MGSQHPVSMDSSHDRPRILILTDGYPPHDRGGAERIAYYHALALRDLGWDVAVFCSHPSSQHEPSAQDEDGIFVFRSFPLNPFARKGEATIVDKLLITGSSLTNPFLVGALKRAVDRFKPDLIHAHYIVRISHSAFSRVAPGVPRVITFHGYQFECPKGGLYRKSRQAICEDKPLPCRLFRDSMTRHFDPVDRIIAISHFVQDRLVDAGHPADKVRYLPNGVPNLESREPSPASPNHQFLFVGRLTSQKGLVELIAAFRQLPYPGARLVIVGDGPDRGRCEAEARGDDRIGFAGWQSPEQVAEHYRNARAVVVPSLWHEVMNTVICEAQSWSRPVVATKVGGNSDLIIEGQSGYLCDPGDVEALRGRMDQLWNDDALTDRLGADGFAHVGRYSMQLHIDSIVDLYRELGVTPGE